MTEPTEENNNSSNEAALKEPAVAIKAPKPHPMENIMKQGGFSMFIKEGDTVEGHIISKLGTRVFLDLGAKGTGIIYGREYYSAQDIIKGLKPGDKISAKVVEADNEEGYVELSLKDAGEERRWVDLKNMQLEGKILDLQVKEANRGGLILEISGVKGFLPASQLSSKNYPRVEGGDKEKVYQELQKLTGGTLKVKILDVVPEEGKLIFTERELDQEAVRQAVQKYKVGDEIEGEITGVVDFGAFVKLDASSELEGLIHISEIDWALVENPRNILHPGEKVKAKIIDIQENKISLSLKALKEDPWVKIAENYKKGDMVRARVTKFNPFGAFVELGSKDTGGIQGLVHISEFGTEKKMSEELELGKEYDFKVLLIDPKEHRMSLGMMRDEKTQNPDT